MVTNIKRTYLSACQYIGGAVLYVIKLRVRIVLVALFKSFVDQN